MKSSLLLLVSVCVLIILSGCGSGGTKGSPVPIVNIVASSMTIALGQSVTLSWTSSYAQPARPRQIRARAIGPAPR